jgi:hypothetical protein
MGPDGGGGVRLGGFAVSRDCRGPCAASMAAITRNPQTRAAWPSTCRIGRASHLAAPRRESRAERFCVALVTWPARGAACSTKIKVHHLASARCCAALVCGVHVKRRRLVLEAGRRARLCAAEPECVARLAWRADVQAAGRSWAPSCCGEQLEEHHRRRIAARGRPPGAALGRMRLGSPPRRPRVWE